MEIHAQFIEGKVFISNDLLEEIHAELQEKCKVERGKDGYTPISNWLKRFFDVQKNNEDAHLCKNILSAVEKIPLSPSTYEKTIKSERPPSYVYIDFLCLAAFNNSLAYCISCEEFRYDQEGKYETLAPKYAVEEYEELSKKRQTSKKFYLHKYAEDLTKDQPRENNIKDSPHDDRHQTEIDDFNEETSINDNPRAKEDPKHPSEAIRFRLINSQPPKAKKSLFKTFKARLFKEVKPKYKITYSLLSPNIYPFSKVSYSNSGEGRILGVYCWFNATISNKEDHSIFLDDLEYSFKPISKIKGIDFVPVRNLKLDVDGIKYEGLVTFPLEIASGKSDSFYFMIEIPIAEYLQEPLYNLYKKKIESTPEFIESQRGDNFSYKVDDISVLTSNDIKVNTFILKPSRKLKVTQSYFDDLGILENDFLLKLENIDIGIPDWQTCYDYSPIQFNAIFSHLIDSSEFITEKKPFWFFEGTPDSFKVKNTPFLSDEEREHQRVFELLAAGRYSEAADKLEKYFNEYKPRRNSEYYYISALIEKKQKNYEIALQKIMIANELSPNIFPYVLIQALCHFELKQYAECIKLLQKFIELNAHLTVTELKGPYELLAMSYHSQGQPDVANEYYEKMIQLLAADDEQFDDRIRIKLYLSRRYLKQRRFNEAQSIIFGLEEELKNDIDGYYQAYLNTILLIGSYYLMMLDFEKSLDAHEKVLSLLQQVPDDELKYQTFGTTNLNISTILIQQKRYDEALIRANSAINYIEHKSGRLSLLNLLYLKFAEVLRLKGDKEQSEIYVKKAEQFLKDHNKISD